MASLPFRDRWTRWIGFLVGLALLGAAAYVLSGHRRELARAWEAARGASPLLVVAVLLLPLGNWAITSAMFWILTRRFARVGIWEMAAIMGSAWLLNMVPLKPGLVGRLAYHKAISGIPVATSIVVTITATLTGLVGIALAIGAQLAFDVSLRAAAPAGLLLPMVGLMIALVLGPAFVLGWRARVHGFPAHAGAGPIAAVLLLRFADTHLWAFRYLLAFRLIGHDQPYGVCVVVAGVSQIAGQLPVQFGVREWAVGVSSGVLRPVGGLAAGAGAVPGLTVDFLCRAAEICCALPVGIVSSLWIHRRLRQIRA
jgi:hypothetical protein